MALVRVMGYQASLLSIGFTMEGYSPRCPHT